MKKIGIAILVVFLALLAAIAVPSFLIPRCRCQHMSCSNNMRLIDGGKEQWAMAANQTNGDTVDTNAVNAYIKGETTPTCTVGGIYSYNAIGVDPQCSLGSLKSSDTSWIECPLCHRKLFFDPGRHIFRG